MKPKTLFLQTFTNLAPSLTLLVECSVTLLLLWSYSLNTLENDCLLENISAWRGKQVILATWQQ